MSFLGRKPRREGGNGLGSVLSLFLLAVLSFAIVFREPLSFPRSTTTSSSSVISSTHRSNSIVPSSDETVWSDRNNYNPLDIPRGQAVNLPSIRDSSVDTKAVDNVREIYGGKGDGKHLGGFTELDLQGVSPATWKSMMQTLGINSVLDVGCGRGISTSWFLLQGCRVQCVEGSHDAVTQSIVGSLDPSIVVEHDYSRGPMWPKHTYDAAWAVEFLEHVGVNYHYNYISTFRKAALLFVTSSRWGDGTTSKCIPTIGGFESSKPMALDTMPN